MNKYLLGLWLLITPLLGLTENASAIDELVEALRPISQMRGEFTQRQYGEDDDLLMESSGRFSLLRPGYFSWEILSPDNQLVIADPEFVWHHDLDLETVTRRPVGSGGEMTPLQILGGDESALRESFEVSRGEDGRFTLVPKVQDVGFRQLTLDIAGDSLNGMEILDSLGQRVVIAFTDVDAEADLGAQDFTFEPPPGADFFYYDQ